MLEALDVTSTVAYAGREGYEWVSGIARFAVDPLAAANERIVDLELAPRDGDGLVRFDADVRLLQPAGGGNRKLLFVVANRGFLGGVPFSLDAPLAWGPSDDLHPGDGFLLEQGWTIAWCGWQWDVLRGPGVLGLTAPEAQVEPGSMRVEWRADAPHDDHALGDSSALFSFADYPTADLDDPDAVLRVRTGPDGEPEVVPRERWRFPDATHVALEGGFQGHHWYELVYRSATAPVVGTGLLAVRDFVAHLRPQFDHALGYGVSQSGRFLRQLVHDGLNVDESGNQVFDGMFSHVASARRGEFNHRYAQPSLTHVIGPGYGPPYDTASLFARQRSLGATPKTFFINTAWEYWRGDAALLHVDADTGDDLPDDPDARVYLLSGNDHMGTFQLKKSLPTANPVHQLDTSPVLRALFVQLDQWACDGEEPPPSQVPRRSDGTAVERAEVLARFAHVATPDPAVLNVTRDLDPDSTTWPLELGERKVALVSAVDDDGNEVAGIRLPAIAAPIAAFTGWNPRVPVDGLPDVLYEFVGSQLPFPPDRPSLDERYPDRDAYEATARRAAEALAAGRFLLEGDIDRAVANALRIYDHAR